MNLQLHLSPLRQCRVLTLLLTGLTISALSLSRLPAAAAQDKDKGINYVVELKYAKAAKMAALIKEVYLDKLGGKTGSASIASDDQSNKLIVNGNPELVLEIAKLVHTLDVPSAGSGGLPNLEFQLRVVWLHGTQADNKVGKLLPREFDAVEPDLAKLGLERPAVAGQLMVHFVPGQPFEVTGDSPIEARWSMAGRASEASGHLMLDLTLTVGNKDSKAATTAVYIKTQIKVTSDRMIVVGAAPTGQVMSAFAVQVTAKVPGASPPPPVKKAEVPEKKPLDKPKPTISWDPAIQWLEEKTGMKVIAAKLPSGDGPDPKFLPKSDKLTAGQAIDVVNEYLMHEKHLLIRGDKEIFLVATADIDPKLVPHCKLDDLVKRGQTELVYVLIAVPAGAAEKLQPVITKMLSSLGKSTIEKGDTKTQLLRIQDTAGKLLRIVEVLEKS
jgi:Bacterial type II/III secretion system short domain